MAILTGVVSGVIVIGLAGLANWLRVEDNRERVRQAVCRHRWKPLDMGDDRVIRLTTDLEECVKCGARR